MLGSSVALKSPAEFYQALHLSPKGDLLVTTRQLLRVSNLANLLDKPTLLRVQPLKDPILNDVSKEADDADQWKLIMLPDGPAPTNVFRSSKSKRKDKIHVEPARFVHSLSTPLMGPRRRCYMLCLQSDGRALLYAVRTDAPLRPVTGLGPVARTDLSQMNSETPLVDFGTLLIDKHFKAHPRSTDVDLNEYEAVTAQVVASAIACSPVLRDASGAESLLFALCTRAGDIHIWQVSEKNAEVPEVKSVADAKHGEWISAADWTLIGQDLYLATGAADGSVKLWKIDAKEPTAVTWVKDVTESDLYRVQALAWAPKQKGILAIAKTTLLELFDLNGKLPQEPIVVHAKPITQIAWRSCGEIIFTTGLDSVIKSWTYLPRAGANNNAAQDEVMEIDADNIRQLSHLNTLDFIPQQWGVMGMALSPNGVVAPVLTFKPAETVASTMYTNKANAALLTLVETNATTLEDTIDFIVHQPAPATYWDLILVLGNRDTQTCLDLLKHIEARYLAAKSSTHDKASKLCYVLYRWLKTRLTLADDVQHVTARIAQLGQQITQHHATRAVTQFLAKKRAPTAREASSLTRLRAAMDPAQRGNIDHALKSANHVTTVTCPFCQAPVADNDHCSRNPAHPLQFCALTMVMIDTPRALKCGTCQREALTLRDEKENNFDWIPEPDLCPFCNSLLSEVTVE